MLGGSAFLRLLGNTAPTEGVETSDTDPGHDLGGRRRVWRGECICGGVPPGPGEEEAAGTREASESAQPDTATC